MSYNETYYEILGIPFYATLTQIKQAYAKLVISYKNPKVNNKEAHNMMYKINEAYMVLRDIDLRMEYDKSINKAKEYSTYERYNLDDLDANNELRFVEWIIYFKEQYLNLVFNYYSKLNIDDSNIVEKLYEQFDKIISYENIRYVKKLKINHKI